ncbi:MAG: hypothetical protein KAT32_01070, partial [Candidatus Moranbacteria bacterium]|nr:hypothetical protein [Candidatus Moranbacteria bacterium]
MNKKIIFGFIGVILIGMIFTMIIYFKKENESVENIKELELLENSIIINFTGHTDTVVKEDVENGENKKEDLNLEVILGDDFFVYKNSSIMKIYNFKTRKIVIANLENNTYEEFSLYSDLGLRLSEFKNSSRINELLDHGDSSSEQILDKTLLEHQFSLQGESLENNINISFENDKTRMSYSDKDKLLFEYTRDFSDDLEEKYKVSIDEMKMFTKFIRYSFGGHPYILDNIVREKNNAIPENVKITQYNFMDQKDYNLFVNSIE